MTSRYSRRNGGRKSIGEPEFADFEIRKEKRGGLVARRDGHAFGLNGIGNFLGHANSGQVGNKFF